MKHLLTFLFLFTLLHTQAQFVTIPDSKLQTTLEYYFPECFNNTGQLDTVCAGSLSITGFGVEGLEIQSLEGMQYFKTLSSFYCGDNLFTELKFKFLPPNITELHASGNQIQLIDSFPKNLKYIDLAYNALKSLPELPSSLQTVSLSNNPDLTCLPYLPANLTFIGINQTGIQCIPNKPNGLTNTIYRLCNPVNNSRKCLALPLISGKVFVDLNKNGIKDPDEAYRKGIQVAIASEGLYTFSNDTGYYELSVPLIDTYDVSANTPYYSSNTKKVTAIGFGVHVKNDIPLQITEELKDLAVSVLNYNVARPGFGLAFKIEIDNIGSAAGTADVQFTLPALYTIDSASIAGMMQAGIITWQSVNLQPGETKSIIVYGTLDASATLGNNLGVSVKIIPSSEDYSTVNNQAQLNLIIQGAYDPNNKQGPEKIHIQKIIQREYIDYIIRFQNTGTDTAFTVVLSDRLDTKLIPSTLEFLTASHNCRTVIEGQQVYFIFENILLPDSSINNPGSCGFVTFRIKALETLITGENIPNYADIYFDYNDPITTNTVYSIIEDPVATGLSPAVNAQHIQIFPNPVVNGNVHISKNVSYKFFNHTGALVKEGRSDGSAISVNHLQEGLYLVEMHADNIYKTEKIIIAH